VELNHVLARETVRRMEDQHEAVIYFFVGQRMMKIRMKERPALPFTARLSGVWYELVRNLKRTLPRDADYANTGRA